MINSEFMHVVSSRERGSKRERSGKGFTVGLNCICNILIAFKEFSGKHGLILDLMKLEIDTWVSLYYSLVICVCFKS